MAFKLRSGFLKAGGFKQMGATPAPSPVKKTYAEAKAADPKLDSYIKQRGDFKAGSDEYEALQAKINKAYGKTRDTKSQMRDTAKLQPKKMEAKKIETPKKEVNMQRSEVPNRPKSKRAQREDKRMEAKGKRQKNRENRKANRDNRKANRRKPETLTAKPGSAADPKSKMTKTVKPADKKVDPKTMKVGKQEGNAGDRVKVSYVKKSAADAPGAKGNQKKDYATPASETKAGKAAAGRKALAEKRAGQTKRQAVRDAKKSADYDTNDRQERKNIRDEAAAMSGGSRRNVRQAKKASKNTGKMTKTAKAANKPEEFKKSNDPKTPMTKYAKPSPSKKHKKGY
tara:strand:- start:176 stop:1198 length:1023 start_codon:yes stop_codon:yes gene_type:complete